MTRERAQFLRLAEKEQISTGHFYRHLPPPRRRRKFAGTLNANSIGSFKRAKLAANGAIWKSKPCASFLADRLRDYPVPPRILLSVHDFEGTPDLRRILNPRSYGEADALKIAASGRTIMDSVRLFRLARNSQKFVAIPMGEIGLPARILALREGSALAYAPVAEATAPGQVLLHDLKISIGPTS